MSNCFTKTNREVIDWFVSIDWADYRAGFMDAFNLIGPILVGVVLIMFGMGVSVTVAVSYDIGPAIGMPIMIVGGFVGWVVWKYLGMLYNNCMEKS